MLRGNLSALILIPVAVIAIYSALAIRPIQKQKKKTDPTTNPDRCQDHLCESEDEDEDEEGEVTKESTCKEQTGTYNNICSPGWGFYAEITPQKLRHRRLRQEGSATKVDQYKI